ncbi:Gag protease polyprotein [Hibiscus syriacus]|uniref:RING-type E3 ubiquitin transferase n=1 Tax=Hibiscus syriacus TaxID=106335 RepID=A0A6A2YDX2_HIBSY|nr:RING-H2 finger protein ATL8-like [Hibiscus syriacus]XP_039037348.1 RING-H2 finger protein ATL8-like [Hibiscus syriacus]KAE8670644.1 Gag protease polyprotein [Hibiscus syriacus]
MKSVGINLVMTIIGFTMSIMFIVFVCTRLICARIQLIASRRSFPVASRSGPSTLERGLHGLESVVVANFPTKKYSDVCFSASEDAQCIVCLSEYHADNILRILPYCGHFFHVTCIDTWLQQHSTCPVCRLSLRESSKKKRLMQPLFSSAVRSHFGTRRHGLPSRNDSRGMDSGGDGLEPGQNTSLTTEDDEASIKDSRSKHVETPSIP